mgnify:CR=1 FL=1
MMMHEQMGGGMMAAMAIFWVLGLIVLGLVIAALVKYLRNRAREVRRCTPSGNALITLHAHRVFVVFAQRPGVVPPRRAGPVCHDAALRAFYLSSGGGKTECTCHSSQERTGFVSRESGST